MAHRDRVLKLPCWSGISGTTLMIRLSYLGPTNNARVQDLAQYGLSWRWHSRQSGLTTYPAFIHQRDGSLICRITHKGLAHRGIPFPAARVLVSTKAKSHDGFQGSLPVESYSQHQYQPSIGPAPNPLDFWRPGLVPWPAPAPFACSRQSRRRQFPFVAGT